MPNALIHEKSPYLLQHAHNPVDWLPWSEEAFTKAKSEDKPVFLSIGYSTCHWCHVMARESFENEEIAGILNHYFISIKVDREERPDIDAVYMNVCQAMNGSGGWPLTLFLTPDKEPFFAGTYFPPHSQNGNTGFDHLLLQIQRLWTASRKDLLSTCSQVRSILQSPQKASEEVPLKYPVVQGVSSLLQSFDPQWGGFGKAPKFPTAHNLSFLLRYAKAEGNQKIPQLVEHTLTSMARGGIYDHLGGGFSRYSTDERWLVPHFEKMLYDNALLLDAYAEGYRETQNPLYARVVKETAGYVLRELKSPEGGFYCGQDADSDGVEGKYYVFSPKEIEEVLGKEDGALFCRHYHLTSEGNFHGKNILHRLDTLPFGKAEPTLKAGREKLLAYRKSRTRLHTDDKILTSWNGLMISALAKAAAALKEPAYLLAARDAQAFIENRLMDENGKPSARYRDGERAHRGLLDDYAFYGLALLDLYAHTWEADYLCKAADLTAVLLKEFKDPKNGGFYLSPADGETPLIRPKEVYDGAIPSGNSAAGELLGHLSSLTGDALFLKEANDQLSFLAREAAAYPAGHCMALSALCRGIYPTRELICVTSQEEMPEDCQRLLWEKGDFSLQVLLKTPKNQETLKKAAAFTGEYPIPEKGTAYYLCKNHACQRPVYTVEELASLL